MSESKILLGFEVPSGEPVYLPLHHLAIFGMTQLSGKTTTLEAIISRSGLKAIAFITKRGESGFRNFNMIQPYYKPRSDWQFIEGLVNVALGEKVKYEPAMRWAIMKVSEGTHDLHEVLEKAKQLCEESKRTFIKQTFEKLVNYLKIVVPELEKWTFSSKLELQDGVNVMNLAGMKLETQQIVIASTIEYVLENLTDTVVVIPEAWEMLPQSRMTPVKWVAERFIRKGAAIRNYLWIDSQDIGGISKVPLRQCDNWLIGRMKEAHEVERMLKQLLGLKVKREEIQTLPLGHFYAVIGNFVKKVYVLPSGVPEEVGKKVAVGELTPEYIRDNFLKVKEVEDELVWKEKYEELKRDMERRIGEEREKAYREAMQKVEEIKSQWSVEEMQKTIMQLKDENLDLKKQLKRAEKVSRVFKEFVDILIEYLPAQKPEVMEKSVKLDLDHTEMQIEIKHKEETVSLKTDTVLGKVMYVAVNEFQNKEFTERELTEILLEHGWNIKHSTLAPSLGNLVKNGWLIRVPKTRPTRYRLPKRIKIEVQKE